MQCKLCTVGRASVHICVLSVQEQNDRQSHSEARCLDAAALQGQGLV